VSKQWEAEKRFTLDCPVCREPALPAQRADGIGGVAGWRLIHPGRIASCFVEEGTDAAESIRTDFNGAFGTNVTSIATQDVTDEINALTGWSKTAFARVNPIPSFEDRSWIYASYAQHEAWENEGGAYLTYKD
jgi:hypothetical protein